MELSEDFVAFEIKKTPHVAAADARSLRGLQELLDKPLLHSFVLSLDRDVANVTLDGAAVKLTGRERGSSESSP